MGNWGRVLTVVGAAAAIACGSAKPAENADSVDPHSDQGSEAGNAAGDTLEESEDSADPGAAGNAADNAGGADSAPATVDDVQAVKHPLPGCVILRAMVPGGRSSTRSQVA